MLIFCELFSTDVFYAVISARGFGISLNIFCHAVPMEVIMENGFTREERNEYRSRFDYSAQNGSEKRKKTSKTDYFVRLVLLQCILCIIVAGGVLLVSKLSPSAAEKMKSDYGKIMSKNMSVSQIISEIRNTAQEAFAPVSGVAEKKEEVTAKLILEAQEPAENASDETVATGKMIGGGEDIASEQAASGTTFARYTVSAPVTVPVENARLTSPFGYRTNPVSGNYGFHTGIDLAAPEGTAVAAAFSGRVTASGESEVWGKYVLLEHSDGFETYYCHLSEIYAPEGTVLRNGETLGLVGSTGWSTGPHLHFEVRIDGIRVNPEPLLYPDEN